MLNFYYRDSIQTFVQKKPSEIIGEISISDNFDTKNSQSLAWESQIHLLQQTVSKFNGEIFFEFSVPRMGKRIDVLLIIKDIIFILEFKVGETKYKRKDIEQVWDYALDLKNFHKPSHNLILVPILIATESPNSFIELQTTSHNDNLFTPIKCNSTDLKLVLEKVVSFQSHKTSINGDDYSTGSYAPTPTIIEAALSLYKNHSVEEIAKFDASSQNLTKTSTLISNLIKEAKQQKKKKICFVTGVPGAGKTLVGLNIATEHFDSKQGEASVYLSGNGPLVSILQEALARDQVKTKKDKGSKITLTQARSSAKTFIQNVHHYRDEYIRDKSAPVDHVAIFDEAQRAWTEQQTASFMKRRRNQLNFDMSEPEFLISCLDRHDDWATIVCLVGGGQEINTGEAGISEWLNAIKDRFSHWEVYISPSLSDSEYGVNNAISQLKQTSQVHLEKELHLSVSMRSYRAENLSKFVQYLLELDVSNAKKTFSAFSEKYPIVLTRDLHKAKSWIREKARGSERYGLVVSSQAERLKPYAVDVKSPMKPIHWFLNDKDDVRSSYYLEQVATEFHIQGLELDWTCLIWDGDLRFNKEGWKTHSFKGSKWQRILKEERQRYLVNAYRVLLTRARQGMIIVVPNGDSSDHTRVPEFYDPTYNYLMSLGIPTI